MTLKELTDEQKHELKQAIVIQRNTDVSYGELANADELVSDDDLEAEFGSTDFTEDDFFCTCQK